VKFFELKTKKKNKNGIILQLKVIFKLIIKMPLSTLNIAAYFDDKTNERHVQAASH